MSGARHRSPLRMLRFERRMSEAYRQATPI